jgi:GNAT superfamily N-acetyltransferase
MENLSIRKYDDADFFAVSRLIQQVFEKYILPDANSDGEVYWSAFHSLSNDNLENIKCRFKSCRVRFVAELNNEIVGTVMGNAEELVRIFVCETCHGKGIGKKLFKSFDSELKDLGVGHYKITASLYAVPFYTKMGCKKSTGIRNFHGLSVQPMKKFL